MSLKDYYLANAEDESKLCLYIIIGDNILNCEYKDCVITIAGKTLDESEQRLERILNNNLIEEDREIGLHIILPHLKSYTNLRIKKAKVKVIDGEVYPMFPSWDWEIKDEEMIKYEKELIRQRF